MAELEVAKLRFRGGIYDDHVLDTNALQVIVAFQEVLTNLAKTIGTDRIRSSIFDRTKRFIIRWIEEECASSLIETVENSGLSNDLQSSDELHQATKLLYMTFAAAAKGEKPPMRLSLDQVNRIASVIDTLSDDSVLEFSYSGSEFQSISHQSCSTVRDWIDSSYEDKTTLTGRVSQVNLKDSVCELFDVIRMRNVAVHYDQQFEAKITSGLKNHANCLLKIEGIGLFNGSKELESLRDIDNVEEVFIDTIQRNESSSCTASIWELVERMTKDIPKEEWDRLPTDLAENHDNYVN